eukprot:3634236-Pyramimonas_sp.AAC.1
MRVQPGSDLGAIDLRGSAATGKAKTRAGLSPDMLGGNKYVAAAKDLNGGKPMSKEQLDKVHADFNTLWNSMSDHSSFEDAYREWQI